MPSLRPGDLLATRSRGGGLGGRLIRLGAALRDQPNLSNHIAVVHHTDKEGTTWVLEGRPGGVGWRDARDYLASPYTVCNAAQPKTDAQRKIVTGGAHALIGTPYDWAAITADAGGAVGKQLDEAWELRWGPNGAVPGHVVCSSLADWLYTKAKLANPAKEREVSPADWVQLWVERGWASRPAK
jgi:hypothetical protein